jgi:uncharacterized protein (TIGR02145 family)
MLMSSAGLPIVKYGYLYNWYVTQGTGNASITSSDDWACATISSSDTLFNILGGGPYGGKLKDIGTTYWDSPNTGAENYGNFSLRANGTRESNGGFLNLRSSANIWADFNYRWTVMSSNILVNYANRQPTEGNGIRLFRAATVSEQLQADGSACAPYVGNDGLSYPTVKIGTQVWLACNLAETKYRWGTDITNVTDNAQWAGLTSGAMCAYDNDINNVFISGYQYNFVQKTIKYGYLYNWYTTQGTGNSSITSSNDWRVPDITDTDYLTTRLGSGSIAGQRLKESGTTYWLTNNGTNTVNWSARGSVARGTDGVFALILKSYFDMWINYDFNATLASYLIINDENALNRSLFNKKTGMSLRLVRQATTQEQLQADGSDCTPYIGNDTQIYPTVKIGTQVWLACNLAETKLRGGLPIPNVPVDTQWAGLTSGAMCAYNNDITNVFI